MKCVFLLQEPNYYYAEEAAILIWTEVVAILTWVEEVAILTWLHHQ
jgi:hypothetical protein